MADMPILTAAGPQKSVGAPELAAYGGEDSSASALQASATKNREGAGGK